MGKLVNGTWTTQWYDTEKSGGKFVREDSVFRNFVGSQEFPADSLRYHLYVSLACPWAHRTLLFRHLKGLEPHISVSVVHPHMLDNGWEFRTDFPEATGDLCNGFDTLWQVYVAAHKEYTGRVTVPVLWDTVQKTIVSNESADIIRMMNTAWNNLTGNTDDYYPSTLRTEIDTLNEFVYHGINNGVYKVGFATKQTAYEEALSTLFTALDTIEDRLQKGGPYLFGETLTEADWRLFTTLIRFDPVYVGHFKCNLRAIREYPALREYLKRLYTTKNVAETVNIDHIKHHYYYSHVQINPTRIVPVGPLLSRGLPTHFTA